MNTNKESISKKKPLYNITPFSLLDYPNKTSCIVWISGCGMRCEVDNVKTTAGEKITSVVGESSN